jgi:hypothetical protein
MKMTLLINNNTFSCERAKNMEKILDIGNYSINPALISSVSYVTSLDNEICRFKINIQGTIIEIFGNQKYVHQQRNIIMDKWRMSL